MERLQEFEHRPVFVLQQVAGDVDLVVRRDADEVLVERSVVDRAEAQAVADERLACRLRVTDDVRRGVQEPELLQAADRARVAVGRENPGGERSMPRLVSGAGVPMPRLPPLS